jgi:hypothetical protein
MFPFLSSTLVVQQLSLLLVSSAFLFLGFNLAVAWGQSQAKSKISISKASTAKKVSYYDVKKTGLKSTLYPKKQTAVTPEFSLPDGEYLEESPPTIKFLPNNTK